MGAWRDAPSDATRSGAVARIDTRAWIPRRGARLLGPGARAFASPRSRAVRSIPRVVKAEAFTGARGEKAWDGFARRGRAGTHHRNGETFTVENGLDPALPGCALTVLVTAAFTATMAAAGWFALSRCEDV